MTIDVYAYRPIGRDATRLFYTICPRPFVTRVDAASPAQILLRQRSPSLFLRLITTRIYSQIVARTNKYLELA